MNNNQKNSSIEYDDDQLNLSDLELTTDNPEEFDELGRKLTRIDVDRALDALRMNEESTRLSEQECGGCCHLLRSTASSRSFLPLARRGRPYISTRSHRLLCSNCTEIKRQQQIDILKNHQQIFETIMNLNLSSTEQLALHNHQYQTCETLVWKKNSSDENTIDLSYDTGSLTENEKKILLDETIKKLQTVLNNRSAILTDDNIEFTYRTLQTTINILSSSYNSI